jgi:hypothetical protein
MKTTGEVPRGSRTAAEMQSRFCQTNSRDTKGNYVACGDIAITFAKRREGERGVTAKNTDRTRNTNLLQF